MKFLYLLQFSDKGEGIFFALVVEAESPADAVVLAGRRLIADGTMPDDGDWFHVEVDLLLKRSGVYAEQAAGEFNLTRVNDEPNVWLRKKRGPKR